MAHQKRRPVNLSVRDLCLEALPAGRSQSYDQLSITPSLVRVLCSLAEAMNDAPDLDTILDLAVKSVVELVDMDSVAVLLIDPRTSELILKAHTGWLSDLVRTSDGIKVHRATVAPPILASVLATQDLAEMTEVRCLSLKGACLQSLLGLPLPGGGRLQGAMVMASHKERTFLGEEIEFLTILGRHVGSAIYRANLRSQELRAVILQERQAMARQMHDDIAQTLTCLGLRIDEIMDDSEIAANASVQRELEGMRRAIEEAYQQVRRSIARLRRDIPTRSDLKGTLQEIIDEFKRSTRSRVTLDLDVDWFVPLSPQAAIQLGYVVREALNNTQKHAQASTVKLSLYRLEDGTVELVILDNGQGFDVASPSKGSEGGLGLQFMAERARRVGGIFEVKSEPGQGTKVIVRVPPS